MLRDCGEALIFDLGANVGQTIGEYRRVRPGCRLHAFEPFEDSFVTLRRTFGRRDGVTLVPSPVCESAEPRVMHALGLGRGEFAAGAGSLGGRPGQAGRDRGSRHRYRLCDHIGCVLRGGGGITRVDALKMDIQGSEMLALEGACGLLAAEAMGIIYTEVLFAPIYEGRGTFPEMLAFLRGFGYQLFGMCDFDHGRSGILAWADAMFISGGLAARLGSKS